MMWLIRGELLWKEMFFWLKFWQPEKNSSSDSSEKSPWFLSVNDVICLHRFQWTQWISELLSPWQSHCTNYEKRIIACTLRKKTVLRKFWDNCLFISVKVGIKRLLALVHSKLLECVLKGSTGSLNGNFLPRKEIVVLKCTLRKRQ